MRFLLVVSLACLALAGWDEALAIGEELGRYEVERPEMGTLFRIVAYAATRDQAEAGMTAALERIAELNRTLSDYDPESELNRLSRLAPTTKPREVSRDLFQVLDAAQGLSEKSDGAFDITVGPLTRLWRRARRSGEMPAAEDLATGMAATGWKHLKLDREHCTAELSLAKMQLDLGGIAKGFAADEALAVLKKNGLSQAMVAASGDLALGDAPPGKKGWDIGLAPVKADGPPTVRIALANCGVSTSGDTFQHTVINGVRYSHIVDPKTGLGLTTPLIVSVVAPNCTQSDGLATAIEVLGIERGLALAEREEGVGALILCTDRNAVAARRSTRFEKLAEESELRKIDGPAKP